MKLIVNAGSYLQTNKMKFVSWLTTFLFIIQPFAYAQEWEIRNSGVDVALRDIAFIDTLVGWAIGEDGIIIKTIDGGDTWQIQNSPIDSIQFRKLEVVNKDVAYIICESRLILSTKNGGTSWIQNESGVDYSLRGISFVNEDTGYVVGGDFFQTSRRGVILVTYDGGNIWEKQYETISQSYYSSQLFRSISFLDEHNGWAFAGDYFDNFSFTNIYRTKNGGKNWEILSYAGRPLFSINVISADTIWVYGYSLVLSFNGGIDWQRDPVIRANVQDIAQINNKSGWVLRARFDEGFKIMYTEDAGGSWEEILSQWEPEVYSLANIGKDHLWAVGDSGLFMKYKGYTVSVDKEENVLPQKITLREAFPNPFNPVTTIRYELPTNSLVRLSVFDMLGREVVVLGDREEGQGSKKSNGTPVKSPVVSTSSR